MKVPLSTLLNFYSVVLQEDEVLKVMMKLIFLKVFFILFEL